MRRIVSFPCEGDRLVGTVDPAPGTTGLLIVSGGSEVRCGAHRGMAALAGRLADAGVPVFRFDRRGVGDSEGENRGYASSGPDIAAALAAFRHEQPRLLRVVGFGNCDAAAALALLDSSTDALVLANPWLGDEDAARPPAAVRAHYLRQMRSGAAWRRALSGRAMARIGELRGTLGKAGEQPLAARMREALARRAATVVLATGDRTAQVFDAARLLTDKARVVRIDTASHSFAEHDDALARILLQAVERLDRG